MASFELEVQICRDMMRKVMARGKSGETNRLQYQTRLLLLEKKWERLKKDPAFSLSRHVEDIEGFLASETVRSDLRVAAAAIRAMAARGRKHAPTAHALQKAMNAVQKFRKEASERKRFGDRRPRRLLLVQGGACDSNRRRH